MQKATIRLETLEKAFWLYKKGYGVDGKMYDDVAYTECLDITEELAKQACWNEPTDWEWFISVFDTICGRPKASFEVIVDDVIEFLHLFGVEVLDNEQKEV